MTTVDLYLREIILRRDEVSDFARYPFALPAVVHMQCLALLERPGGSEEPS